VVIQKNPSGSEIVVCRKWGRK